MRVVDLFSGCGGMSLGFQEAGFKIVHAVDNWKAAINVYEVNFNHPISNLDIAKDAEKVLSIIKESHPDIIIGGPPCQDFSSAGKRIEGERADLTYKFADIIAESRPKWFVMENVERIKNSDILNNICDSLKSAGYGLSIHIINASLCGVPQNRKRFFMVGRLNAEDGFLNGIIENNLSGKPTTIREYLGNELGLEYYYRHPRTYERRGIFSIDEPSATIRGVNRPVPPNYQLHPAEPKDIDLSQIRALTEKERSRLQTFPADFKLSGTKTDLNQMIGNAVPVQQARFIAQAILEVAEGEVFQHIQPALLAIP